MNSFKLNMKLLKIFLKSWQYYPEMVTYLKEKCGIKYHLNRFGYCMLMCENYKVQREARDYFSNGTKCEWRSCYRKETKVGKEDV